MKPFSLDNVLAYRKRLADLAQQRFLEACNVHRSVEQRLAEETALCEELSKESEQKQRQGMAIIDLIRYEERIMQVQANIAAIAKNLEEKALAGGQRAATAGATSQGATDHGTPQGTPESCLGGIPREKRRPPCSMKLPFFATITRKNEIIKTSPTVSNKQ
jgi:hypothetical protein